MAMKVGGEDDEDAAEGHQAQPLADQDRTQATSGRQDLLGTGPGATLFHTFGANELNTGVTRLALLDRNEEGLRRVSIEAIYTGMTEPAEAATPIEGAAKPTSAPAGRRPPSRRTAPTR